MTAVSPVVKPVSRMRLAHGSVVTIEDVSWAEFESILQELGDKRSLRVTNSNSTLEIMVPLPEREKPKTLNLIYEFSTQLSAIAYINLISVCQLGIN